MWFSCLGQHIFYEISRHSRGRVASGSTSVSFLSPCPPAGSATCKLTAAEAKAAVTFSALWRYRRYVDSMPRLHPFPLLAALYRFYLAACNASQTLLIFPSAHAIISAASFLPCIGPHPTCIDPEQYFRIERHQVTLLLLIGIRNCQIARHCETYLRLP